MPNYRWRRGPEAALVALLTVILSPQVLALAELVAGGLLMLVGLLWLASRALPRRRHRRFDILALLVSIIALLEARKH